MVFFIAWISFLLQMGEMNDIYRKIKDANSDKDAGEVFSKEILSMLVDSTMPQNPLLTRHRFPPIFHEWFIETFPEPSAWFTSRLSYNRSAAVMSMVGFILG